MGNGDSNLQARCQALRNRFFQIPGSYNILLAGRYNAGKSSLVCTAHRCINDLLPNEIFAIADVGHVNRQTVTTYAFNRYDVTSRYTGSAKIFMFDTPGLNYMTDLEDALLTKFMAGTKLFNSSIIKLLDDYLITRGKHQKVQAVQKQIEQLTDSIGTVDEATVQKLEELMSGLLSLEDVKQKILTKFEEDKNNKIDAVIFVITAEELVDSVGWFSDSAKATGYEKYAKMIDECSRNLDQSPYVVITKMDMYKMRKEEIYNHFVKLVPANRIRFITGDIIDFANSRTPPRDYAKEEVFLQLLLEIITAVYIQRQNQLS